MQSLKPFAAAPAGKARVFVVDDHPVFREGLVRVLNQEKDLTVCGTAPDASEALRQIRGLKPDLVMVDVSLEGMNGIDLTKNLRSGYPHLPILVLSMHKESLYAERALRAGANGYMMKKESGPALLAAVRQVLRGQTYTSEELKERLLSAAIGRRGPEAASGVERLSDRELDVFRLIGEGLGTRQIAEQLNVSMKTVETHREHIREKLHFDQTYQLVQYAVEWRHSENT